MRSMLGCKTGAHCCVLGFNHSVCRQSIAASSSGVGGRALSFEAFESFFSGGGRLVRVASLVVTSFVWGWATSTIVLSCRHVR